MACNCNKSSRRTSRATNDPTLELQDYYIENGEVVVSVYLMGTGQVDGESYNIDVVDENNTYSTNLNGFLDGLNPEIIEVAFPKEVQGSLIEASGRIGTINVSDNIFLENLGNGGNGGNNGGDNGGGDNGENGGDNGGTSRTKLAIAGLAVAIFAAQSNN